MSKRLKNLVLTDEVLVKGDVKPLNGSLPIVVTTDNDKSTVGISIDKAAAKDGKIAYHLTVGEILNYLGGTWNNVSSFEVHPGPAIRAGDVDPVTKIAYANDVEEGYVQQLHIFSRNPINECDIEIDWGDNTVFKLRDMAIDETHPEEGLHYIKQDDEAPYCYRCEVGHTYGAGEARYKVSVAGDDVWCLRTAAAKHGEYKNAKGNLVSGIFLNGKLTISDSIINASSMYTYSNRLLKVDATGIDWMAHPMQFDRLNSMFAHCKNLSIMTGMGDFIKSVIGTISGAENMFQSVTAMKSCDCKVPSNIGVDTTRTFNSMFWECTSLETPVQELLPSEAFTSLPNLGNMFYMCTSLTGSVPGSILWEDASKAQLWNKKNDTSSGAVGQMFKGTPADLRKTVPATKFTGVGSTEADTWNSVIAPA